MTVGVMSITPFTAGGELDAVTFAAHLRRIAAHDVSIYLCSQGSGEGLALSTEEKADVYRAAVEAVGGRRPLVGAGVGLTGDTGSARLQASVLGATGVDALQVFPPRTGALRPRDREIERYFDEVIDVAPCPVIIGENVTLVGYELGPALVRRLVQRAGVVGLSYTVPTGSIAALADLLADVPDTVEVRVGLVHHLVNVAALGGAGILCFDGNLVPGLVARAWAAARAGDPDLGPILRSLFAVNAVLTRFGNPASIKAALAHFGLPAGELRPPFLGLDDGERAELAARLDRLDGVRAWV